MTNKFGFLFVPVAVSIAVAATYFYLEKQPQQYLGSLTFQIASPTGMAVSLDKERDLLTSHVLLSQVVKDLNIGVANPPSKFRGLDLGASVVPVNTNLLGDVNSLSKNLNVKSYADKSWMVIEYRAGDQQHVEKTLKTIFQKYSDWRKVSPVFNDDLVRADQGLIESREAFLKSQNKLLDFVEKNKGGQSNILEKLKILEAEINALRLRYGPKHPVLLEKKSELDFLQKDLGSDRYKSEMRDQILKLKQAMEKDFQQLDLALRQTVIADQSNDTSRSVKILPLGDVDVVKLSRVDHKTLFLSGLIVALASIMLMLVRQLFVSEIRSRSEIEGFTSLPIIGEIDGLSRVVRDDVPVPTGALADRLKSLRQELKLRGIYKLMNFTSTSSGENATELALGLGRLAARAGEKVLVIEANLKDPELIDKTKLRANRNLVDYLSGQSPLEDIIIKGDPSGLHCIFGISIPKTGIDLLSSDKMKVLLLSLREVYDLVIVLSASVDKGPDARVMGAVADQTIYVVEPNVTKRKSLQNALLAFHDSVIDNISFILASK